VKPIQTCGPWTGIAALAICAILSLVLSVPPGSTWILNAARQTTQRTAPNLNVANR